MVPDPADAEIVAAVACSFCGAEANQPCRWQEVHPKGQPHTARRLAWLRLLEAQGAEADSSLDARVCSTRSAEEALALAPEIVTFEGGEHLHELWWDHWRDSGFGRVPTGTWPILKPCPTCGEQAVVRIIYGYPNRETARAADLGEVILGGCKVPPPDRRRNWLCRACGASE